MNSSILFSSLLILFGINFVHAQQKRFILRLDNLQDYYCSQAQQDILNFAMNNSYGITAGIISDFYDGLDTPLHTVLQKCAGMSKDKCALFNHGKDDKFLFGAAANVSIAKAQLQACDNKIKSLFNGYTAEGVMPYQNSWGSNMLQAMTELGYTIVTASKASYSGMSWDLTKLPIQMPQQTETASYNAQSQLVGVMPNVTAAACEIAAAAGEVCVIMMTPVEFDTGLYSIVKLRELMDLLVAAGFTSTNFHSIAVEASVLTNVPTTAPTVVNTVSPSEIPTMSPTWTPSQLPSATPSAVPSVSVTETPSLQPSSVPSPLPTILPTASSTFAPSMLPSMMPSISPTVLPGTTNYPSISPTCSPTVVPTTTFPTIFPTTIPTTSPSILPTISPTISPTIFPTNLPTIFPSSVFTRSPSTVVPTVSPTIFPTMSRTVSPTVLPTTALPSTAPSTVPTTIQPTITTTISTTVTPSKVPTQSPSPFPSRIPTTYPGGARNSSTACVDGSACDSSSSSTTLSAGWIAGIVIGSVLVVALLLGAGLAGYAYYHHNHQYKTPSPLIHHHSQHAIVESADRRMEGGGTGGTGGYLPAHLLGPNNPFRHSSSTHVSKLSTASHSQSHQSPKKQSFQASKFQIEQLLAQDSSLMQQSSFIVDSARTAAATAVAVEEEGMEEEAVMDDDRIIMLVEEGGSSETDIDVDNQSALKISVDELHEHRYGIVKE